MGQAKEIFENSVTGLAGSVTGAIGNELGYAIGNLTGSNQRRADEQYKQQERLTGMQKAYQSDLMKESYGLQKGMWDDTNYEAQVEHAKNAGLNPAMLYAKGGPGGSTGSGGASVGGASASDESSRQAAQTQQSGMGLQLEMMKSQIEVNKSIAAKNTAEAKYTGGSQTELAGAQTELIGSQQQKIETEIKNLMADTSLKGSQTELNELQQNATKIANEFNAANNATLIKSNFEILKKLTAEANVSEQTQTSLIELAKLQIKEGLSRIALNKSNVNLNEANESLISAKISEIANSIMITQGQLSVNQEQLKVNWEALENAIKIAKINNSAGIIMKDIHGVMSAVQTALTGKEEYYIK